MTITVAPDETAAEGGRWTAEPLRWMHRLAVTQVLVDVAAVLVSVFIVRVAFVSHWVGDLASTAAFAAAALALCAVWIAVMALGGAYSPRDLSAGNDQYRDVVSGAVRVFALIAIANFYLQIDVSRLLVSATVLIMTALTIVGRSAVRKHLHHRRVSGLDCNGVIAIGQRRGVADLAAHFHGAGWAGFRVVGACFTDDSNGPLVAEGERIEQVGDVDDIIDILMTTGANVVALAGQGALEPQMVQRLAWRLEGRRVDLLVAPDLFDVVGPRIRTHPVAGLPLLHVDEPRLSHPARFLKGCIERVAALALLVLVSPVLLGCAIAIKATTKGPVLFRQRRVGRNGETFMLLKLRSMVADADKMVIDLQDSNETDGPLFKMRRDPRITKVGHFLRRFSLDELPQLVHVASGRMALVGPRPPLPSEVGFYEDHVRRRLLVRPGLTGLWQVSGRSDLGWDESVKLDLYYVDNWSLALDAAIIAKTVVAVVQGRGAY
jgi:exopolysaccharide biosynthesis polyprenyl glycosylphosphotransferase